MAQVASKVVVNNFVGGLVTDYHELNTPQNVTVDEDNCDLDRKGSRRRRLGIDFEENYEFSDTVVDTTDEDTYMKTYKWKAVNNDANVNFLVVQMGSDLAFFDMSFDTLSAGELSFTVDLDDYLVTGALTMDFSPIQVTSGKGVLFVVGKYIDPLIIEYDAAADDITVTELHLEIRDLVQQENDSSMLELQEATVSNERLYDLFNQGWSKIVTGRNTNLPAAQDAQGDGGGLPSNGGILGMIEIIASQIVDSSNLTGLIKNITALDYYKLCTGVYPPKTKPWYVGKRSPFNSEEGASEVFDPEGVYNMVDAGNSLAPLGHYILDPFRKDRTTVSGISDLTIEVEETRPTAVIFYSGRLFYGFENTLFFSQLLNDDLLNADKCYQVADPTSADINDLVATDGGTITIPESSTILAFEMAGNNLVVFAENGIWVVSGSTPGDGFSATGFSVQKVSNIGITSDRNLVSVEGNPVWWADAGIFTLTEDAAKQGYDVKNLCQQKIQEFYDAIPPVSKMRASGAYDKVKKVVTWIFNSTEDTLHGNVYACDRMLNHDVLLGAWYPYTISDLAENSPFITDVFSLRSVVRVSANEDVVDRLGATVVDQFGATVYIIRYSTANTANTTGIKFLTIQPA